MESEWFTSSVLENKYPNLITCIFELHMKHII